MYMYMYMYLNFGAGPWAPRGPGAPFCLRKHSRVVQNRICSLRSVRITGKTKHSRSGAVRALESAAPEPSERSKALLELASEQLLHSKMLIEPAPDATKAQKCCSSLLRGSVYVQKCCSSLLRSRQSTQKCCSGLRKCWSKYLFEITFRNNFSKSQVSV